MSKEAVKSKLISEFERLEGISCNQFDEKDWARFDRFIESREKENWEFERSSGYDGYRNKETGEWKYKEDYDLIFKQKESVEEAAEKYIETSKYMRLTPMDYIKFGARWQEDRMYSEEELLFNVNDLLNQVLKGKVDSNRIAERINTWFNKFKK